jgi:hypothetical protein
MQSMYLPLEIKQTSHKNTFLTMRANLGLAPDGRKYLGVGRPLTGH